LTHIGPDYLKFLNSWGKDFGDNGFFSVSPGVLIETRYFDVFWEESDLSNEEKEAYKKYVENGRRTVKEYLEC
jgi:aminopeptidase C